MTRAIGQQANARGGETGAVQQESPTRSSAERLPTSRWFLNWEGIGCQM